MPQPARNRIIELASRYCVRYQPTAADDLADTATALAGDTVRPDDLENLVVALKRARVISGAEMVALLSDYLNEKHQGINDNDA
jgi:hypothetical protein|tara:strand:+ start:218 stop:469 length:252 start_codon:yes stop_codon:yes gene_type:complete